MKTEKTWWTEILKTAKSKNIEVFIDIEDAWDQFMKQKQRCALSGVELFFCGEKKNVLLDRKSPDCGYTVNNIQWIHQEVGQIKKTMSNEKLIFLMSRVAEHQEKKHAQLACKNYKIS